MLETTLRGHYQIVSHIGGGGFGQTYLAKDIDLPNHPYCVVKQLKPKSSETFILETAKRLFNQEAEILYKLGSRDQIPRLLAHFQEGEEFYLVQEFADGTDLTTEIGDGKCLNEPKVIELLQEILEILTFVHSHGVVHRDIKPANLIRRNSDRKIVLIDFGAVKEISSLSGDHQANTNITIAIGSPGYMPIEQLRGKPRFSSDIYAVGMMMIQAITGQEPKLFAEHPDTAELTWRDHIPTNNYSPQLLDILDKMIRYDFRQRYQTAEEVIVAIAEAMNNANINANINVNSIDHALPTIINPPAALPETMIQMATDCEQNCDDDHLNDLTTNTQQRIAHLHPLDRSLYRSMYQQIQAFHHIGAWLTGSILLLSISIGIAIYQSLHSPKLNAANNSVFTELANKSSDGFSLIANNFARPQPISTESLSADELLSQARVLSRNNSPQEALIKIESAIQLNPNNANAWLIKGLVLRSIGRDYEAIAAFGKALELQPDLANSNIFNREVLPRETTQPSR